MLHPVWYAYYDWHIQAAEKHVQEARWNNFLRGLIAEWASWALTPELVSSSSSNNPWDDLNAETSESDHDGDLVNIVMRSQLETQAYQERLRNAMQSRLTRDDLYNWMYS